MTSCILLAYGRIDAEKEKIQPEYVVIIYNYQCQAVEVLIQFTVVSGITGRVKLAATQLNHT
jgi:hypothetical protein